VCAVLCVASVVLSGCSTPQAVSTGEPPRAFRAPAWEEILGGDSKQDPTSIGARLEATSNIADAATARAAARAAWLGELGVGPAVSGYHLGVPTAACTGVRIVGVSPWEVAPGAAKALVAWQGTCQNDVDALDAVVVRVAYVYLARVDGAWVAVQPGSLPQRAERPVSEPVSEWLLTELACSSGERARIEVAAAWAELCADAKAAGVVVEASDAHRTADEQRALWDEAVREYGRDEAARRVGYSDGVACSSRHCAGEAIDVRAGEAALRWLRATTACAALDGSTREVVDGAACQPDERAVARFEQYGFTAPLAMSPSHLEWGLQLSSVDDECNDSPARPVPELIAAVWRCELRGLGADRAADVAAQAVAVAKCASGFAPGARVLDGRYAIAEHPVSKKTYPGQGVFGLPPDVVGKLVAGGEVADAWASTTAAVRWWLLERSAGRDGWGPFVCTSDDGVLTDALAGGTPEWARAY
jgi:hypothetical protein